ncbi:MAG: carbon storage regulator [Pirellulaceae bacterium]|nr:carbon storage regulator [Pirellulaceae bacterium]
MLVITRKEDQRVMLIDQATGQQTIIEIVNLAGNRAKLGITAPSGVRVLREELLEKAGLSPFSAPRSAPVPAPQPVSA